MSYAEVLTRREGALFLEDVAIAELAERFVSENGREPSIAALPHGHLTVPRLRR